MRGRQPRQVCRADGFRHQGCRSKLKFEAVDSRAARHEPLDALLARIGAVIERVCLVNVFTCIVHNTPKQPIDVHTYSIALFQRVFFDPPTSLLLYGAVGAGWPKPCRSAPPRSDIAKGVPSDHAALSCRRCSRCSRDFGAARAGTAFGNFRPPRTVETKH